MQKIVIFIALILLVLQPTLCLDLPNIQLSTDTVVGNILYEPLTMISMAILMLIALVMA
jgi:hypothetical protein